MTFSFWGASDNDLFMSALISFILDNPALQRSLLKNMHMQYMSYLLIENVVLFVEFAIFPQFA